MRSLFVEHEGKEELRLLCKGTMETVDFGTVARRITDLVKENIRDPSVRNRMMPSFSTTTKTVNVVTIPAGFASVPLVIEDHGRVFDKTMVAGLVGILAEKSSDAQDPKTAVVSKKAELASIRPVSGWWMYLQQKEEKK
ncbi:hypothetical protein N7492_004963 [Penicillium capsulatum]|uniref:Uncharacterized protein n=1 Tax=Penicillium capsulatum TaxID=69766 RepID=A0A9W9IBF7_9EURO|nr:hypothetical protein N7492_004963 [Penicillium capsulatum]KAJ6135929.1 hypothetical protein N7512_001089 [Penicillium capsulatum]